MEQASYRWLFIAQPLGRREGEVTKMGNGAPNRLWLIDAGYLLKAQSKARPGYQFSYPKLRQRLEQDGALWRAYYLNSTPNPPSDQQDGFHIWLRSAPPRGPKIVTKLYKLRNIRADTPYCETCQTKVTVACPSGPGHKLHKQQQKGVDVGIATLALVHADKYETLVLSSGDADLLDAIEYLSERGKRIELLAFRYGVATDLQSRADRIYWIDDFLDEVAQDKKEPVPTAVSVDVADEPEAVAGT
jgi:uncharacterized LabA/DUF88 family protein